MKVHVLGAAGGAGRAVTAELVARGHHVVAVTRAGDAPLGHEQRAADLTDLAATVAATAGADVVVLAAQPDYPQWASVWPPLLRTTIEASARAGARLVLVDNLYMYGSPGTPITEDTPQTPGTRKGRLRRELAAELFAAHEAGTVRATAGRFADYYGPRADSSAAWALMLGPLLQGTRPRVLIDGDQPRTFSYLPDAARGFATLVEDDRADGRPWILPSAPPTTQRELIRLAADRLGVAPRIGTVTKTMLRLAGIGSRMMREMVEMAEQWDRPYTTDASQFVAAFGPVQVSPHDEAVAATLAAARAGAAA